jgi:phenylalanyl-tRNA synthetase alpha chain
MKIIINSPDDQRLRDHLAERPDAEARRIERFLALPDLSRQPGNPLKEIVDRTLAVPRLQGFDTIEIPEIIPVDILFDLFNMPAGHPARSKSDTYYVDEENVLRTHDTVFWYYYLNHPGIKERLAKQESFGAICHGKVYRKDEIDRRHMNVFHQMGGLYLAPISTDPAAQEKMVADLKATLGAIASTIFGPRVEYRFYDHTFPYTDPSFEMEAFINNQWVEMLGSGLPRPTVLANFGVQGYYGWAFGFGLERLAIANMELPDIRLLWSEDERVKKQLQLGHKYKEVSKYPAAPRDISFIVPTSFVPNNYFDLIRDLGGDLVEQVELVDKYENAAKFGADKVSYTYRITYRAVDRTLTGEEINPIHKQVEAETKKQFNAEIR